MAPFSNIVTELGDIEARLRAEIPAEYHHIVDDLKSLIGKLTGEAETDAAQVAHEAAPAVATAEHDAAALASEAVAGAEQAVQGTAKPGA